MRKLLGKMRKIYTRKNDKNVNRNNDYKNGIFTITHDVIIIAVDFCKNYFKKSSTCMVVLEI
jgi:hypothetical protein